MTSNRRNVSIIGDYFGLDEKCSHVLHDKSLVWRFKALLEMQYYLKVSIEWINER